MKILVVFCTIRHNRSLQSYAENFRQFEHNPDVLIVDETAELRKEISKTFNDCNVEYYGAKERLEWLQRNNIKPAIIPSKFKEEVSFAFLVAHKRKYDMIAVFDDDTFCFSDFDILAEHYNCLFKTQMPIVSSSNSWINPYPGPAYARGYPYKCRSQKNNLIPSGSSAQGTVLNLGLWLGVPDLNAIDYLYHGSLTGTTIFQCNPNFSSFIAQKNNFLPICGMNIAFQPKIIPAFYQLPNKQLSRFGDIFSGYFLKKIADQLGDNISFGPPLCRHDKAPRDIFLDIESEKESLRFNETLCQVLPNLKVQGSSYADCYGSLAEELLAKRELFHNPRYVKLLATSMKYWSNLLR